MEYTKDSVIVYYKDDPRRCNANNFVNHEVVIFYINFPRL